MRTEIDPWFVTGWLQGAGSFTFNRSRSQLTIVFAIRTKPSDRPELEALQRFFRGVGRIYATSASSCLFRVNRPSELLRIVEHFDEYPLRGEKRKVFETWREMVLLRASHHGARTPRRLIDLAASLRTGQAPGTP